jgi:hypothetical protein
MQVRCVSGAGGTVGVGWCAGAGNRFLAWVRGLRHDVLSRGPDARALRASRSVLLAVCGYRVETGDRQVHQGGLRLYPGALSLSREDISHLNALPNLVNPVSE